MPDVRPRRRPHACVNHRHPSLAPSSVALSALRRVLQPLRSVRGRLGAAVCLGSWRSIAALVSAGRVLDVSAPRPSYPRPSLVPRARPASRVATARVANRSRDGAPSSRRSASLDFASAPTWPAHRGSRRSQPHRATRASSRHASRSRSAIADVSRAPSASRASRHPAPSSGATPQLTRRSLTPACSGLATLAADARR